MRPDALDRLCGTTPAALGVDDEGAPHGRADRVLDGRPLMLGEVLGPEVAGLMSTFPGVTLTVLWLDAPGIRPIDGGPGRPDLAERQPRDGGIPRRLPVRLPTFTVWSWGTLLGYLASLAILALVVGSDGIRYPGASSAGSSSRTLDEPATRPSWPKARAGGSHPGSNPSPREGSRRPSIARRASRAPIGIPSCPARDFGTRGH